MVKKVADDKTPVAKTVVTMCSKCKLELNHIVILHNKDGIVDKVKCNTCGSEHKYRPKKTAAGKKATTRRGTRKKKLDPAEIFSNLDEKFKDKSPEPYSMSGSYDEKDVIEHEVFGKGFITNLPTSQQIEVAFIDGTRTLARNR